jgi:hypothetical protein
MAGRPVVVGIWAIRRLATNEGSIGCSYESTHQSLALGTGHEPKQEKQLRSSNRPKQPSVAIEPHPRHFQTLKRRVAGHVGDVVGQILNLGCVWISVLEQVRVQGTSNE